jgi:hypothetical protein
MLPKILAALQNSALDARERYRLCTNVQARHPALQRVARFMNSDARQLSYYAASEAFGLQARLTAFTSARNIVRIRTNDRTRDERRV